MTSKFKPQLFKYMHYRFFFISDDELLSILGSSDPHCVQEHIIKMYDNIARLQFQEGISNEWLVTGMISAEGEVR